MCYFENLLCSRIQIMLQSLWKRVIAVEFRGKAETGFRMTKIHSDWYRGREKRQDGEESNRTLHCCDFHHFIRRPHMGRRKSPCPRGDDQCWRHPGKDLQCCAEEIRELKTDLYTWYWIIRHKFIVQLLAILILIFGSKLVTRTPFCYPF